MGHGVLNLPVRPALGFHEGFHHPFGWICFQVRLELKTLPDELDLIAVGKFRQGGFKLSFADVTKWTHDVGPNFRGNGFHKAKVMVCLYY
jgi:hypothetical protein